MPEKLFEALKKDHDGVRGVFENLMHARKPDFRQKLMDKLKGEILPHLLAEERSLYPVLRDECRGCRKDVLESFEEHHVSQVMFNELQELPVEDERFEAKATVLRDLVLHHLEIEETRLFEDIRKNIKPEKAEEILQKFLEEKEKARGELH